MENSIDKALLNKLSKLESDQQEQVLIFVNELLDAEQIQQRSKASEKSQRIADQFRDSVKFLETLPHRNPQEKALENANYTYRFLLFKRTNRSDIKIIYRIDEDKHRVYVTDFFPTEKDLSKLVKRNK